jgi:hypothetical protein
MGVPVEVGFEWTSILLRENALFWGFWRGTVIEVQMGQAAALYCRAEMPLLSSSEFFPKLA